MAKAKQLRKQKGPKKGVAAQQVEKSIKTADAPNSNDRRPICSLELLDFEGEFGWARATNCQRKTPHGVEKCCDEVIRALRRLQSFSEQTWGELLRAKKHFHTIPVEKLSPTAQDRLTATKRDDIDELALFRISSTSRVFGIRTNEVFQLLWLDPDHQVYPTKKKRT